MGYGCSIYVVSALAGNAWRESHINPALSQKSGTAFGMFQWDGSRKKKLLEWLEENGYEKTDPIGQMEYLIAEDEWSGSYAGISSLSDFLDSESENITDLTSAFCKCWERPGKPYLEERIDFANKALSYIYTHDSDETISEWETEPMYYLSESQALKNAVLMYRYLGGELPPTPPTPPKPSTKTKKIPLWMMIRYHI